MKRVLFVFFTVGLVFGLVPSLSAQQPLGDIARENRKANKPKAIKVYDNDNLPTTAPISMVGVVNTPDSTKPKGPEAKDSDQTSNKKTEPAATDTPEARAKILEALKGDLEQQRTKVADLTQQLDLLNREYRLRTALYYSDAGYRLRAPQVWAEEDQRYRTNISDKQQELTAAQAKLADLEEAARKSGMPSKSVENPNP